MSDHHFVGGAPVIQQEYQNTIGSSTNGHTFILTLTDLETPTGTSAGTTAVTATLASPADTTAAAAQIAAQFTASNEGLFKEISFTSSGAVLVIRPKIAGRPMSISSYSGGTGTWTTTVASTVITPNGGPYDFKDERNFRENDTPSTSDNVILCGNASPLYNTFNADVTWAQLSTSEDWSGNCPHLNCLVSTGVEINGRGTISLNVGTSAKPVTVNGTANLPNGAPACVVYGSAITVFTVNGGSVGLSPYDGEAAVSTAATTVNVNGGRFRGGSGCTTTTINQNNANSYVYIGGDGATFNGYAGKAIIGGTFAWALVSAVHGQITCNTTGTITSVVSKGKGFVDFNASVVARTVTDGTASGKIYAGSHITRTNPFTENVVGAVQTYYEGPSGPVA